MSSTTFPTGTEVQATREMPLPCLRGEAGLCGLCWPQKCSESPAVLFWLHECVLATATLSTGHPTFLPPSFFSSFYGCRILASRSGIPPPHPPRPAFFFSLLNKPLPCPIPSSAASWRTRTNANQNPSLGANCPCLTVLH